jgi:hypothetical protein
MPGPPGLRVVKAIARLVPAHLREGWVAEWEGELAYAWRRAERTGAHPSLARGRLLRR